MEIVACFAGFVTGVAMSYLYIDWVLTEFMKKLK